MKPELKLDIKDLKLVNELERNARSSVTRIAKVMGVSKEVANYRFKRLLNAGFIGQCYPLIDYFSIGYELYCLYINLYNLKENTKENIVNELKKLRLVEVDVLIQSNWDIVIYIWVKKAYEFYSFYDMFIESYASYIQDKEFSIVTRAHYFSHAYLYGTHDVTTIGKFKELKLNDDENKLLEELQKDARIELVQLSKKIGCLPTTLSYKLKSICAREIIKGFFPKLNVSLLGYDSYKVKIILANPLKKKAVVQYLKAQPNVTKILESIGETDIEVEADFKTAHELDDCLRKMRITIPFIRDFEVINILKD